MKARVRLLLPEMESSKKAWGGGGGFGWVDVEYSVNPVGSASLYKLKKVFYEGKELCVSLIERLNPPDCVDETIARKIHGKYAREVQNAPIAKKVKKKKAAPPKDEGQHEMKL